MSDKDAGYFYRRAVEEIAMAQKAELPTVVAAHYKFASAYLKRLVSEERAAPALS